jgi:hypothetical protein
LPLRLEPEAGFTLLVGRNPGVADKIARHSVHALRQSEPPKVGTVQGSTDVSFETPNADPAAAPRVDVFSRPNIY